MKGRLFVPNADKLVHATVRRYSELQIKFAGKPTRDFHDYLTKLDNYYSGIKKSRSALELKEVIAKSTDDNILFRRDKKLISLAIAERKRELENH